MREKSATAFGPIAFLPIDNRVSAPLPYLVFKLFKALNGYYGGHRFVELTGHRTSRRDLLWRHRHCGGVVIDDHPLPITFGVNEGVAGGQALAFAVLDGGKRVGAGIHGSVSVDANQLIAKRHLVSRKRLKGVNHVVSNCFRVIATLGRQGTPQHRFAVVERKYTIRSIGTEGFCPLCSGSRHLFLVSGRRCERKPEENNNCKQDERSSNTLHG